MSTSARLSEVDVPSATRKDMSDFGHTPSGRIVAGVECLLNACSCFCDCFARSSEDFRGVASCPKSSAHKAWLGCHIHCCEGQVKFRVEREIGVYWYLFSNHYTRKCIHKK